MHSKIQISRIFTWLTFWQQNPQFETSTPQSALFPICFSLNTGFFWCPTSWYFPTSLSVWYVNIFQKFYQQNYVRTASHSHSSVLISFKNTIIFTVLTILDGFYRRLSSLLCNMLNNLDNWHMKVAILSAPCTGRIYPSLWILLIIISVTVWVIFKFVA